MFKCLNDLKSQTHYSSYIKPGFGNPRFNVVFNPVYNVDIIEKVEYFLSLCVSLKQEIAMLPFTNSLSWFHGIVKCPWVVHFRVSLEVVGYPGIFCLR